MRVKLSNLKRMCSFSECEEFKYGGTKDAPTINGKFIIVGATIRFEIYYHGNNIVTHYPNGLTTVDSCGWLTANTASLMYWFMPEDCEARYRFNYSKISLYRSKENERIEIWRDNKLVDELTYNNSGPCFIDPKV